MADLHNVRSMTRDIGPMSLRASVVPSSLDEERRTVDVVWTTGARVLRGFFEKFYEELAVAPKNVRMERLNSGAPLLDAHNGYDNSGVIGVVEKARIKNKQGEATVRFARAEDDPNADAIFRKVRDGIIRNVSVGYRVHRFEKVEESDDKVPVYRAVDWEPYEISLVPMGADAGAGVRSDTAATNPCTFVEPEPHEETRMAKEDKTEGAADSKAQESAPGEDASRVRAEAAAAERDRITVIQRTAKALDLDAEFAREHVDSGTGADEFRKLAIDKRERESIPVASDAGRVQAVPGGDTRDKFMRGAGDWLLVRSGIADQVRDAAKKRGEQIVIDPGEFRGYSLVELARLCLERAGVRTGSMSKMELVGAAFTARGGGYAATGDFTVLLENVMHKALLASYGITPDTWSRFCDVGSVSDFRPHNRYRLGSLGAWTTVNEHGEFQRQSIPDGEKQSISAATKGTTIAITRQAIVNDDMAAFVRLASQLGRSGKLTIEVAVYALIAENAGLGPAMSDGNPLFDASHDNLGTGSALSETALDDDRVVMAIQTDPSGKEILDLRPAILLLPIGLGAKARKLNNSEYSIDPVDPGTNEQNRFMEPNSVAGLFRDVVDSPRLTGTRRYMFADPSIAPVIEVAFLDGQQEPYMELKEGWQIDGSVWKGRLDFGVAAVDFRGAVTNAGTT